MTETLRVEPGTVAAPDNVEVGDYLQELLVTDTVVYLVASKSASGKTVTLRRCGHGETVKSIHHGGNPYPVNYAEAVPLEEMVPTLDEDSSEYPAMKAHCDGLNARMLTTLRFRKDGTLMTHATANPMRHAHRTAKPDGTMVPVARTDYRE